MSDFFVSNLRCEYLVNPLGIDERSPRLSWEIESDRRGARQTAFRVRVASSVDKLVADDADLWDSGRMEGSQTAHVAYAGCELRSRKTCHWNVEVWDERGNAIRSDTAYWTMGLLDRSEWSARWITANPLTIARDPDAISPALTRSGTPGVFRRRFEVAEPVRRATLYASARGVFELEIDGMRVGEDLFAPEWTDYFKRIQYRTYDVTKLITPGRRTLSATLGDGWWSGFVAWLKMRGRYGSLENSLLVQLEIELISGRVITVGTDRSWRSATGPILSSDLLGGEVYDARRKPRHWLAACLVPPPEAVLVAQRSQPVRCHETLPARAVNEIRPGVFIFDLGQNITGWIRLKLTAPAGTRITLRHAERLNPDGTIHTENLRSAKATDVYICRGDGEEVWQPHFTFHGFQYVELSGFPGAPSPGMVTGCVVHSATPSVGFFECSHAGVNQLWRNTVWSQRDNFLSVPTDCPQRDERLGWMGDAQVFLRTASYHCDVAAFFTKWMIDVEDAQTPNGIFSDTAPRLREDINFSGLDDFCGAAGWADAGIIVPWTIWRVYGDRRIIERHWRAMTAWLDYIERTNPDGLRTRDLHNNYGDWLCMPTDTTIRAHSPMKNLLATAYWADDAAKMARMAREVGRPDEAARFQAMFERVRKAFQDEFVRDDGQLAVETQTAYLLALAFNLLPENVRARAAERLVANIRELNWHLSTGFIGVSHLNPILTLTGHADVAYRLLLQDNCPSWLYPIRHGATTIWERWNGWTHQDGFFEPSMNSFNHYSLGSVCEWLFRHVLGIELDEAAPGFERFVLRPYIGPGLDHARGSYRSLHGEILSAWCREGQTLRWSVKVPANTTARIYVPSAVGSSVSESGRPPRRSIGLRVVGRAGAFLLCEAQPGAYEFCSIIPVRAAQP
jgi:alpha-L-rhamnosidase